MRELQKSGFVRLPTVLEFIPISESSWWEGVKIGRYPKSHKLGRTTVWLAEDIHQLIDDIQGGLFT